MVHRRIILSLYFLSGVSALVYEIVWARMLGLIVGTAVAAWAAVLMAYMGGMALGAFFGGRTVDRVKRPLLVFAFCEAGVGLFGAASPAILHAVQNLCVDMTFLSGPFTGAHIVARIIIAGGILIIPTTLMGATFPAISRVVASQGGMLGRDLGVIYAVNTFGAIIGTIAAGFFLIPGLGMSVSIFLASAINCLVSIGAIVVVRRKGPTGATSSPAQTMENSAVQSPEPWLFPLALACSGFCAMAFEVLWSRALVFFLMSTTYAFTTVLSVMLIGLAIGGLFAAALAKKRRDPTAWLAALMLCIGIAGFASPFLLHALDPVIHFAEGRLVHAWWQWITIRYVISFAVIFPPAFCMGVIYPLAIGASCRSINTAGRTIGSLSSLNTLGGIAGSLAAAFLLVPAFGIQRSLVIVAIINCIGGFIVIGRMPKNSGKWTLGAAVITVIMGVAGLAFSGLHPMVLYSRAIRGAEGPVSLVSYKEDQVASVAVIKNVQGRTLNIDGFNAAGTYRYEYMHLLAHLPILLSPSPDSVLVICFGTGTTCGTAAIHPTVKQVDCAEISPAVVGSARYFSDVNYHAAKNPKVRIIIDDGRNYLLRSQRRYNVITLEPMHPYLASATNLYSADFYKLCRLRLAEHGVMAQWAPLHVLSRPQYRMLIASFVSAFPHTSLWFLGTEGILIGSLDSLHIDIPALKRNMADESVHGDLAKISLASPQRLLSCFLMGERQVHDFVKDVPVISDDCPGIEFSAPLNLVKAANLQWLENMEELIGRRASVLPFVGNINDTLTESIKQCSTASSMIMTAEIMNSRQRFFQALTEADSALRLMPGDTTARMVRREAMDNAALAYLNGARGLRSQGLLLPAEAAYLRALAIDSSCAPAHTELATLYTTLGMVDKSLEQAQKAVDFSPGDPSTHTNLAVVYMNLHRAAQSEAELLRAIAINERYGPAHYFLGALYNASGRTEMAQAEVKRAKDLGYSPRPR
jgi:spermidine synthase